jgi:serine/threonine protein kinase
LRQVAVAAGQQIAGYRIESMIARGGMAVVYRATELQLARTVALKLLSPDLTENEQFEQRFIRESQLAAACDHPNIIPIYAAGEADGVLYIAMRYVEGQDLSAVLKRESVIEPERAMALLRQVAAALDAAHERGLVHRDVKPGNILVASGAGPEDADHVYLTDFGVTKKSNSMSGLTQTGSFVGTIDYISPEQISGRGVSARTDVYALGCVVYQALTGSVPFPREEDAAVLWAHLSDRVTKASSRRPQLNPQVDDVIERALAKNPEVRFPSCRAFIGALEAALTNQPTVVIAPTPSPAPTAPPPRVSAPGRRAKSAPPPRSAPPPPRSTAPPTPGSAPSKPRRRARRWLIGAAAVLVAVVAGVLVVTLGTGNGSGVSAYSDSEKSTKLPAGWDGKQHGTDIFVSFAPRADDFRPLFDNTGQGWPIVGQLSSDPSRLVGVYLGHPYAATAAGPQLEVTQSVGSLVGPTSGAVVSVVAGSKKDGRLAAGGYTVTSYIGTVTGPDGVGPLEFEYFFVQITSTEAVALIDFGDPVTFVANAKNFDLISSNLVYK